MATPLQPLPRATRVLPGDASLRSLPVAPGRTHDDYEFQVVTIPRGASLGLARTAVTEQAEYGRWDLVRTQLFYGGARKVWMRRRIMRIEPTMVVG